MHAEKFWNLKAMRFHISETNFGSIWFFSEARHSFTINQILFMCHLCMYTTSLMRLSMRHNRVLVQCNGVWYIAITIIWKLGEGVYGYTKQVNRVERGCTKVNGGGVTISITWVRVLTCALTCLIQCDKTHWQAFPWSLFKNTRRQATSDKWIMSYC